MALASNALTTVANLRGYMRETPANVDHLSVYHDATGGATAATVQVTSAAVVLVITGGGNAGTETLTFAAYSTAATMVAAINALATGWVAAVIGNTSRSTTDLVEVAATSAYGAAAVQYLQGADVVMHELAINSVSDLIERHTQRVYASTDYVHLLSGTGTPILSLPYRPVTKVERVSIGHTEGMTIRNTSTDAQAALVRNDGTNLICTVIGGANAGEDEVAIGSNTITQLAAAVVALGDGWTASAASSTVGGYDASELIRHEARSCLGTDQSLLIPNDPISGYSVDASGRLRRAASGGYGGGAWPGYWGYTHHGTALNAGDPRMLRNPGMHVGAHWPQGQYNVQVRYTAGYSSTPTELEVIAIEMSADLIRRGVRDRGVSSWSLGDVSWSALDPEQVAKWKTALAPWRSIFRADFQNA